MTDVGAGPGGPVPGGASGVDAGTEPARMSPLSRYFNVFFSPGAVFDDIRRDPRGWWVPILIGVVVAAVFASVYFQRFNEFQADIEREAGKSANEMMKSFRPPEEIDKEIQNGYQSAQAIPAWQRQVNRVALMPAGSMFFGVWVLTIYFTIIGLAMGWLKELRGWRFILNILISVGVFFLTICSEAVPRAWAGFAARRGEFTAAPTGVIVIGATLSLFAAVPMAWILFRSTREKELSRIVGAIPYALAPSALAALVGVVVAIVKTPDPTSLEELVPSNLAALLGWKGGALASLAGSLDIFSIWTMVLLTIGLARAFGKRSGAVAPAVFVPWAIWILGKAGIAAIFAAGS